MIKAPNNYSPYRDMKRCRSRRDAVLQAMCRRGWVTETALQTALKPYPSLALVWVGFDNGDPIEATGAAAALPIWTDLMKAIPQYRSETGFKREAS